MPETLPPPSNSPEARTPEGEIKPVGPTTTPPQETPLSSETQPEPKLGEDGKPIVEPPKADDKAGAPEKYEAYKVPEGTTLDEKLVGEANELFKKHNISQSTAQEIVDFHIAKTKEAGDAPYKAWQDTQDAWKAEIKADPEIGGKLDQVKASVGKLYDALGDPKLVSDFKTAMEFTGAGNNPAFVKALYRLSQKLTEGGPVLGRGPVEVRSPTGQSPSVANAMFPNLK